MFMVVDEDIKGILCMLKSTYFPRRNKSWTFVLKWCFSVTTHYVLGTLYVKAKVLRMIMPPTDRQLGFLTEW